jgi:hypothetical protein
MKLKQYIREVLKSNLTIEVIARLEGYKSAMALHQMYARGAFEKLDKIVKESQERFDSICKKRNARK